MEGSVSELRAKVESLKATIDSLPAAETQEQQAALDGLNELLRIFQGMSDSAGDFVDRQNWTENN